MRQQIIKEKISKTKKDEYVGYARVVVGMLSGDELELLINNDIDQIMSDYSDEIYQLSDVDMSKFILSKLKI